MNDVDIDFDVSLDVNDCFADMNCLSEIDVALHMIQKRQSGTFNIKKVQVTTSLTGHVLCLGPKLATLRGRQFNIFGNTDDPDLVAACSIAIFNNYFDSSRTFTAASVAAIAGRDTNDRATLQKIKGMLFDRANVNHSFQTMPNGMHARVFSCYDANDSDYASNIIGITDADAEAAINFVESKAVFNHPAAPAARDDASQLVDLLIKFCHCVQNMSASEVSDILGRAAARVAPNNTNATSSLNVHASSCSKPASADQNDGSSNIISKKIVLHPNSRGYYRLKSSLLRAIGAPQHVSLSKDNDTIVVAGSDSYGDYRVQDDDSVTVNLNKFGMNTQKGLVFATITADNKIVLSKASKWA